MCEQSSTKAFIARLGEHGDTVNFPRVREVLLERDECRELAAINGSEDGKADRIVGVDDQRVFDSEPHRQRAQHSFPLSSLVQSGANDLHGVDNEQATRLPTCSAEGEPAGYLHSVTFDDATEARAYFVARVVSRVEDTMKTAAWIQFLAALLIFGLGVATGLVAQTTGDSPNRAEQKRTDLTGAPGMEVIASIVEFKPGESGEIHFHHGVEAAYVLQGATLQSPGKDPNVVPTGTTILNLRDVKHGGFKVVGDTSYKLFTVHVVDKAKPLYDYSK